jgi:hypothetical protein
MANDGILRTNQFDRIIETASQGETIGQNFEAMKAALHLAMAANPSAATQESSFPDDPMPFTKEIHWAESAGRRPMRIRATSQADLDALESQILYGR